MVMVMEIQRLMMGMMPWHVMVEKLFDEAEAVPHGTGTWYGQALPVPMVVKPSGLASSIASSSRCVENQLYNFCNFKLSYLCPI
jgi:hypothetical protein